MHLDKRAHVLGQLHGRQSVQAKSNNVERNSSVLVHIFESTNHKQPVSRLGVIPHQIITWTRGVTFAVLKTEGYNCTMTSC